MELLFKNKHLELFKKGLDSFGVIIYSKRMANKVNKVFKTYPGYLIQVGEEPLFSISGAEMDKFLNLLPKEYRDIIETKIEVKHGL